MSKSAVNLSQRFCTCQSSCCERLSYLISMNTDGYIGLESHEELVLCISFIYLFTALMFIYKGAVRWRAYVCWRFHKIRRRSRWPRYVKFSYNRYHLSSTVVVRVPSETVIKIRPWRTEVSHLQFRIRGKFVVFLLQDSVCDLPLVSEKK